ncbi:MAG: response regulator, partial [Dyadobacter sp.]
RFRQAEDSTTRKYGGTGLGLSIVRDLVYLQDGNIEVQSNLGEGTKVSFSIPYRKLSNQNHISTQENKNVLSFVKPDLKILVVEDNEINQGLISRFLKEDNIQHSIAGNGKEAIALLKNEYFHLVFMDIQMPEMDGYSATQYIRQTLGSDIPIVAMTANAMAGEREKCLALGMNEYLSKPLRKSILIGMINRFSDSTFSIESAKEKKTEIENDFCVINLYYMKEIGKGDREYEKLVTEQFINLLPEQLAALSHAFAGNDSENLKCIAHNMRNTISIMGLDDLLSENLNSIENENTDMETLETSLNSTIRIGQEAILEAKLFYSKF